MHRSHRSVPHLRRRFLPAIVATALLSQACATTGGQLAPAPAKGLPPPTEADFAVVARLREGTPARIAAQAERLWRLWTTGDEEDAEVCASEPGTGCPAEPTEDDLGSLRRVRAASCGDERRALRLLEAHLAAEFAAQETAALRERAGAIESGARLEVDGEAYSFRELGSLLARETDHGRRMRIAASAAPVLRDLDEVADETEARIAALAERLGYRDAAELRALSLPLPMSRLKSLAADFLKATDDAYRLALAEAARRELGIGPGELRRADLPALFAGVLFDVRYPREGGREALEKTFAGLGLGAKAVRIDDAARTHRLSRPACFPVAPPHDVRLALPPVPIADWRPLLREASCAMQAAHATPDRFELTSLGHPGAAAGLSLATAQLAETPAWLRSHTLLTEAEIEAQLAGAALQRLFVTRRAAGKILVASGRDYRASMELALGVPVMGTEGARWLSSREGGDSPRDFVSWLVGAMATARLEELHGAAWWEKREAGETLAGFWGEGGRLDPDRLAKVLGGERLEAGPLAARLVSRVAPLLRAPPPGRPPSSPPSKEDAAPLPEQGTPPDPVLSS
ncbi:MAG TPA: hypothetical protein VGD74_05195 [Vulgatibacter sp.]